MDGQNFLRPNFLLRTRIGAVTKDTVRNSLECVPDWTKRAGFKLSISMQNKICDLTEQRCPVTKF